MRATRMLAGLAIATTAACGSGNGGGTGALDPSSIIAVETYVKATNTGFDDQFGTSVGIDGDVLVVGAPRERSDAVGVDGDQTDNSLATAGAAYVYVGGPGGWVADAYLKATDPVPEASLFGDSVAVSGDTIVVGAPIRDAGGAAYVFVRVAGVWTPQQKLVAPNAGLNDSFGSEVAIDGDTIVVAAPEEDSDATTVDGDGANDDAVASGAAYVFVRTGVTWALQAYLKASDGAASARFGLGVGVSGDRVVVGAPHASAGGSLRGSAYVFLRSGTTWSEEQILLPSLAANELQFGGGVDIDGNVVAVGSFTTAAFVFVRASGSWAQEAVLTTTVAPFVNDAWSEVAVSGDRVVVGAELEDGASNGVDGDEQDDGAPDSGAAYLFERIGSAWVQVAYLKATDPGEDDTFGSSVAVSGDAVAVGAPFEDSSTEGVGVPTLFDFTLDSGAAYVYR